MKSETKELIAASRELIRRLLGFIPSQESIDWSQTYAARWRRGIGSEFIALSELDGIDLDDLLEIEISIGKVVFRDFNFLMISISR